MKSKKNLKIFAIIAIVLVVIICAVLITQKIKGKEQNVTNTTSGKNNDENVKGKEKTSTEKNDSLIIDGVEYVDTSKNFKDVNRSNFSFFCNQDRTKYLTYKKSNEKSKLDTKVIYNFDGRVSAVFYIKNKGTEIIVSDENFEVDGKKLVTDSKTLLFEENNLKCYIDDYKKGYYMHQYVANIDGVEVSIYTASKTKGDETLKNAVKEIIGDLSVDKKVGFYLDHYLSYDGLNGISLKSYKLIGSIDFTDSDQLLIGGNTFWYSPTGGSENIVPSNMVNCEKIKDRDVGYNIIKRNYGGNKLSVYIYDSTDVNGEKVFLHNKQVIWMDNYDENKVKPEEIVKLYLDNLVVY